MKKKKIFVLLLCVMLISGFYTSVSAANKNVTTKYKKQVTKMLNNFDSFFGYGCAKGKQFKYDDYAKTGMVYWRYISEIEGKTVSYAKNKLNSRMKLYFGTTTVKLKKFSKHTLPNTPSYMVQNKDGKIFYVGGDWGAAYPVGTVKKIEQMSSDKFVVTYRINMYADWLNKNIEYMGTYKVYLKKAGNKNGFVITNIKRTETKNVLI